MGARVYPPVRLRLRHTRTRLSHKQHAHAHALTLALSTADSGTHTEQPQLANSEGGNWNARTRPHWTRLQLGLALGRPCRPRVGGVPFASHGSERACVSWCVCVFVRVRVNGCEWAVRSEGGGGGVSGVGCAAQRQGCNVDGGRERCAIDQD